MFFSKICSESQAKYCKLVVACQIGSAILRKMLDSTIWQVFISKESSNG